MQHAFYKRQKGFTLLELLVVITLLAVLAVGALVAYEGVGDQAGATAAANNTATVDQSLRNYRAVTKSYPNQWDNLSNAAAAQPFDGATGAMTTAGFRAAFGDWTMSAPGKTALVAAFKAVGIDEVQQVTTTMTGVAPNLQHNEGANPTGAAEKEMSDAAFVHVGIVPDFNKNTGAACTYDGVTVTDYAGNTATAAYAEKLNKINDSLDVNVCDLVVALGFGHDAAHSTTNSSVAIAQAPTHTSKTVNPANNYARYVALFHIGSGANSSVNDVDSGDIETSAHLIAVVDPEGNPIDVNLMAANANN